MINLKIVLRTCDAKDVHPERGERFIKADKQTIIKKCLLSLLFSASNAKELANISFNVVDDHSSEEMKTFIKNTISKFNFPLEFFETDLEGFNYSAFKQFEFCRNSKDYVYSVEDDYLHTPDAIVSMVNAMLEFEQKTKTKVAIKPDDDPYSYASNYPNSMKPCLIFLLRDRHWRTIQNTHNTFMTHSEVFRSYWELFASLARFYKSLSIDEEITINKIWNDGVVTQGPVPLFSPIETLAIHISQGNEPSHIDYKTFWDSIQINE